MQPLSHPNGVAGRLSPDGRQARHTEPVPPTLAQIMLSRARRRAALPLDIISFVAPCPACGRDCEWTQIRQETRVRSTVSCPCSPGAR